MRKARLLFSKGRMLKVLLVLLVSVSLLNGCRTTSKAIDRPQDEEWGEKGTQPEKVWSDYAWIIMSKDKFLDMRR